MPTNNSAVAARELTVTRLFRAPRELVFRVWTDPAHLANWWGPARFTNPRCDWDVRPGGKIHVDMRAPDGAVYPMGGEFREILPPEKLVFLTSALDGAGKPIFQNLNTVLFKEFEDNQTLIELHVQVVEELGDAEQYLKGMELGWSSSLDKLEAYVGFGADGRAAAAASKAHETVGREIRASRIFRAPRALVWRLCTEPEHIKNWWGPNGFTTIIEHMDVRPGGEWRFVMHGPDGIDYPNHKLYEVVKPIDRLVMNHVCQPHHRMEVVFADVDGGTEVKVWMLFPTAEECQAIIARVGADQKLVENLVKLEQYLMTL
ncbi:SRPBCC domain-containing protein [Acidicapsa dinghuensis]|uniref:SRPBCC domain-containing protein n=1 Tax=Acidicapsa dinghuensis TaxID=2218256 RepID=A0ABW1EH55_9BACT|nr:SRPBCC domain-containing protein [Acidicapsa dinghuensis]